MRIVRYNYPATRSAYLARSPWSGLENEIDRFFTHALGEFKQEATPHRFPIDLYDDQQNTYLRAELPGVERAALQVEWVDGFLNITASRKVRQGDREDTLALRRSVSVPEQAVQTDKVSASYENGVLTVTLPKREETKPRKLNVTIN